MGQATLSEAKLSKRRCCVIRCATVANNFSFSPSHDISKETKKSCCSNDTLDYL